jgi:hypothetical protein
MPAWPREGPSSCPQTPAGLRRTQVPGDVIGHSIRSPRGSRGGAEAAIGNSRVAGRGHRLTGLTQYVFFIRRLEGRLGQLQARPLACPGPISITSGSMSS